MATTLGLGRRLFQAAEAVPGYCIVDYDHADDDSKRNNELGRPRKVLVAEDASAPCLGPIQQPAAAIGDLVEVPINGQIAHVKITDTIQPGDPLMNDSASNSGVGGCAKKATTGNFIIGFADDYGVTGDIIDYVHYPHFYTTS